MTDERQRFLNALGSRTGGPEPTWGNYTRGKRTPPISRVDEYPTEEME